MKPVPSNNCANCNALLFGPYCHTCGQSRRAPIRSLWDLISNYFGETLNYDSRLLRTLRILLTKPGHLSNEYLKGHRVKYTPPLRLYIVISLIFFLIINVNVEVTQDDSSKSNITKSTKNTNKTSNLDINLKGKSISWLSEEENKRLREEIEKSAVKLQKKIEDNPQSLLKEIMTTLSKLMFVLLPVFALILKASYSFSKRFYMEHLIQALYTHSFLFLIFVLLYCLDFLGDSYKQFFTFGNSLLSFIVGLISLAAIIYIPIYLYKALRLIYRQNRLITFIKFSIISISYCILLGAAFASAFVITALKA